jgi:hypothetical protein
MRVAVSGSSGMIGSALVPFLTSQGHQVFRLVRSSPRAADAAIRWDPAAGTIDAAALEGIDGIVHLAGENIVGRWSPRKKAAIRDSRVRSTQLLAETAARRTRPPSVLVCASAIGYYGDRGDELLHEASTPGRGFLADVCQAWEAAAAPAAAAGIRTVHLRIGVVLARQGGALAKMLLPFQLGLGGMMGHGRQHWSWVAIDDILGVVQHALVTGTLRGPVNTVAPNPVTNREFTRILGDVLHRPTICPVPAFAVQALLGEMADAVLLASARVEPRRLLESGYVFRHPHLDGALRHVLGR